MNDLTAQQLADTVLDLFERCPELRPDKLSFRDGHWWYGEPNTVGYPCDHFATQLCESQMVRWLAEQGVNPMILKRAAWEVQYSNRTTDQIWTFSHTTIAEALTAACTAVLEAKAEAVVWPEASL